MEYKENFFAMSFVLVPRLFLLHLRYIYFIFKANFIYRED
jgi:hypothetical protein